MFNYPRVPHCWVLLISSTTCSGTSLLFFMCTLDHAVTAFRASGGDHKRHFHKAYSLHPKSMPQMEGKSTEICQILSRHASPLTSRGMMKPEALSALWIPLFPAWFLDPRRTYIYPL
ncbi:unnamed protein product [Urochloa humidicola]